MASLAEVPDAALLAAATCTALDPGTGYTGQKTVTVNATLPPGAGGPYSLAVLSPCRVLDTRDASSPTLGQPLAGGDTLGSDVAGRCGVSPTAKAVAANVTVTQPAGSGYIVVFPGDEPEPVASTVHFSAGRTRATSTASSPSATTA